MKKYLLTLTALFLINCGGEENTNETANIEQENTNTNETANTEQKEPKSKEPSAPVFTITTEPSSHVSAITAEQSHSYLQYDGQEPVNLHYGDCIKVKESQFAKLKIFLLTAAVTDRRAKYLNEDFFTDRRAEYLREYVVCNHKTNDCPTEFEDIRVSCYKGLAHPCPVGHFRLETKRWGGFSVVGPNQTILELKPVTENTNKNCREL